MSKENKKTSIFNKPLLSSKVKGNRVTLFPEAALGYLVGPMFALISSGVINTFLTQYYDKVLGLNKSAPLFETLLPILSAIVIIIGNLLIGKLINRKPTAAGKARPLILLGLPILAVSLLLLFLVPMNYGPDGTPTTEPSIWSLIMIAVGYNFYYAFAYPFYFTPHSALVNLSTRDGSARSLLATASNASTLAAAGLAGMIGPILVDLIGLLPNADKGITAENANGKWTILMIIMIALLVVGCLLEYYFTRERITEETLSVKANENVKSTEEKKVTMGEQIKICVHDKYWWIIILFFFFYQLGGQLKNNDATWYAQSFATDGASTTLAGVISMVGAIPTALGMIVIWPLANKFGKSKCIKIGAVFACLMGALGFIVLIPSISENEGLFNTISIASFCLKAIGTIPAMYISMALMSDVLDHQEALYGKRTDGFTMAVYGSIMVGLTGIANGIIVGLNNAGLDPKITNTALFSGAEGLCYLIIFLMFLFMNVEKFSKLDHQTIIANQKAAVLAEGGAWVEPEERAKLQEEENAKLVEEGRIAELKDRCSKKGLSFEEEEAKYQSEKAKKEEAAKLKAEAKEKAKAVKEAQKKAKYDALSDAEKESLKQKEALKIEKQKKLDEATLAEFNKQLAKAKTLSL